MLTDIHDPCRANMEKADRALRAALDEIERLMADRDLWKSRTKEGSLIVEANVAEVERLRTALQFYADDCGDTGMIARRALEPKP